MSPNDVRQRSASGGEAAEQAVMLAIEAAVWAPSVHNTQPWRFGTRESDAGPVISLHADVERRLDVADPDGREMLISCGAALFTLRLALEYLGHEPEVTLLPDPDRPGLLADLRFGRRIAVGEEARLLYGEVRRRRSHRGVFRDTPVTAPVQSALADEARQEGAALQMASARSQIALGALTEAADQIQRMSPAFVSEVARWSRPPDSPRLDGMHHGSYPHDPGHTEPHFPMRDFARGHGWGVVGAELLPGTAGITGAVALLTTRADSHTDWLTAGQALQRVLLRASAADLSAAFHTQALEIPELREFIRTRFCDGSYPQVLIRLGVADGALSTVRQPADQVTSKQT